jgi:ribosomal protein S27AE
MMKDEMTRRDFLRAAGVAAAGISLLHSPAWARDEKPKDSQEKEKPEEDEKSEDKEDKDKEDEKEEPNYDELFAENSNDEEETRACPQCGALMYRQGRTWTCENCGYSYVE